MSENATILDHRMLLPIDIPASHVAQKRHPMLSHGALNRRIFDAIHHEIIGPLCTHKIVLTYVI